MTATEYQMPMDVYERIINDFTYHPPNNSQIERIERYAVLRESAKQLALLIAKCSKQSREQSLALTKLEEAIMWANAAIARNE